MARKKTVVQVVPAIRALTAINVPLALVTFAVTLGFASHRISALVTMVVCAALYAAGMILMTPMIDKKTVSPIRVSQDELPPTISFHKGFVFKALVFAAFYVAAVVAAVAFQDYIAAGMTIAVPVILWNILRRSKRVERAQKGVLWRTTQFAWTSKGITIYLVAIPAREP